MSPTSPEPGETIRGYARRTGVSYRQARRIVSGKVYESDLPRTSRPLAQTSPREPPRTHGSFRAIRRKARNDFWLDRWRAEFPQENRSDSAILRYWRESGFQLPRVGTHNSKRPTSAERRRMDRFLAAFGMTPERRRAYLGGRHRNSDPLFDVDEDTGG